MPELPTDAPGQPPARRRASSIVIVNTGDGKGKSTAAFGTMLRAVAMAWPVAVVQFLKSGEWKVGEEAVARRLGVDWYAAGDGFTWESDDLDETRAKAVAAWALSAGLLGSGRYRLLILDEATYAMAWGWIATAEVVATLADRSPGTNVVVTGRHAPPALVHAADTVTEMVKVKHVYDAGVRARRGIDY
ncbi:MAG TPA: cob(I)yrinic acid a,c-diamide adenosyltransferase [Acidimicrobiales bacterium]|nr:cob(I)yrinic acid a,c-diamide adenosyltransferase [Acidimicrobiales bacterium]